MSINLMWKKLLILLKIGFIYRHTKIKKRKRKNNSSKKKLVCVPTSLTSLETFYLLHIGSKVVVYFILRSE